MKYIHLELSNLIGLFERTMVQVCIYMFVDKKKFESYVTDQLTFSNIHSRTSHRIYRLSLLLHAPEMLSSSSK